MEQSFEHDQPGKYSVSCSIKRYGLTYLLLLLHLRPKCPGGLLHFTFSLILNSTEFLWSMHRGPRLYGFICFPHRSKASNCEVILEYIITAGFINSTKCAKEFSPRGENVVTYRVAAYARLSPSFSPASASLPTSGDAYRFSFGPQDMAAYFSVA